MTGQNRGSKARMAGIMAIGTLLMTLRHLVTKPQTSLRFQMQPVRTVLTTSGQEQAGIGSMAIRHGRKLAGSMESPTGSQVLPGTGDMNNG